MITVEMLPAHYGDALLVSWPGAVQTHNMLIDGGLIKSGDGVAGRLKEVGGVDLVVMTHVDQDHIGGVLDVIRTPETAPLVRGIWFNAYAHLVRAADMLGPVQGERLTEFLVSSNIPWNEGWPFPPDESYGRTGGPVVRSGLPPVMGLPGGATITLLSPTTAGLAALETVWAKDVRDAGLEPGYPAFEEPEVDDRADMLGPVDSLQALADKRSGTDRTRANGSSIAFVLEHSGTRVLFAGDAQPRVLIEALSALSHGDEPYRLDAVKLPHHGSKKNLNKALVAAVSCPLWLVSTNGDRFSHPNDEALARVIVGTEGDVRFVGNYPSKRWKTFVERYSPQTSGYTVELPPDGEAGITVQIGE